MKRRIVALVITVGMCMVMTMSAYASSSTTDNNSSRIRMIDVDDEEEVEEDIETEENEAPEVTVKEAVEEAKAGEAIDYETVYIAVVAEDGKVMTNTLEEVVQKSRTTMEQAINSIIQTAQNQTSGIVTKREADTLIMDSIQTLLTTPPSPLFIQNITALAQKKGADMEVNHCGTVKTAATAEDAFGNTIASAGVIANVTADTFLILVGFHEDNTVEHVEGFVDPVTGMVLGIFQRTPDIITVLVLE